MSGVQHENTPKKMGVGEMESLSPRNWALLSLYAFAAAQVWDFYPADILLPQIIPGDVSDITHKIQPRSGGTNKV